jgi:hypothetical protein
MPNVYACIIQNDKPSAWIDTLRGMPVIGSPLCDRFLFTSAHFVNERLTHSFVNIPMESAEPRAEYSVLAPIPFDMDLDCEEVIDPASPTGIDDVFHVEFDVDMEDLFNADEVAILDLVELDWL